MDSFFDHNAGEHRGLRKWFIGALIVSLIIHGILIVVFRASKLERFDTGMTTERLVPRGFAVKQAKIDPKVFDSPEPRKAEASTTVAPPKLPEIAPEKPAAGNLPDKVKLSPSATELAKPLLNEKPSPIDTKFPQIAQPNTNAAVEKELDSVRNQITSEAAPKVPTSPVKLPSEGGSGATGESGSGRDVAGFSNLNDLLAQSGPLTGEIAPVNMPGGALFEYDSADLLADSIETLQKLGELIRRNPRATFSIEGHSDSFGNPEYNHTLSEARAQAVKTWLTNEMGIDPARIETRGFGSTRLIAPASGTREEQQINRRVEIVIRTPKS